ncbi:hypothetical protein BGM26_03220 [Bacillus sp. FJAT-29790]|uniref:hypothetical protein n=1 Tax=Bacillus sp. FJAT-29790 TaxID=1895002 RepID=UPI001C24A256|nr:hypothetical protein [Bacillus sp. FJAT-29790]MBU8878002.1 hypothetical protein [Bacillus sp. FJAT-29790]
MWIWFLLIIIPIIILAIIEETIYFFVNRSVFGQSNVEKYVRSLLMVLKGKISNCAKLLKRKLRIKGTST